MQEKGKRVCFVLCLTLVPSAFHAWQEIVCVRRFMSVGGAIVCLFFPFLFEVKKERGC
jgi:hypothetical protein